MGGTFGQFADFVSHHGKAATLLAGARRLDGRVERKQIGLIRNVANGQHDAGNLAGIFFQRTNRTRGGLYRFRDVSHFIGGGMNDPAAFGRRLAGGFRQGLRVMRTVAHLFKRNGELIDGGSHRRSRFGLGDGGVRTGLRRFGQTVGGLPEAGDFFDQIGDQFVQLVPHHGQLHHDFSDLVIARYRDWTRQIAAIGDGMNAVTRVGEMAGNIGQGGPDQQQTDQKRQRDGALTECATALRIRQHLMCGGFRGRARRLALFQDDILDRAPERRFLLVQQGHRIGLLAAGRQFADARLAGHIFRPLLFKRGQQGRFGIIPGQAARGLQCSGEILFGGFQIAVRLGVGRVQDDIAYRLAGLQTLRIHFAIGQQARLIL